MFVVGTVVVMAVVAITNNDAAAVYRAALGTKAARMRVREGVCNMIRRDVMEMVNEDHLSCIF